MGSSLLTSDNSKRRRRRRTGRRSSQKLMATSWTRKARRNDSDDDGVGKTPATTAISPTPTAANNVTTMDTKTETFLCQQTEQKESRHGFNNDNCTHNQQHHHHHHPYQVKTQNIAEDKSESSVEGTTTATTKASTTTLSSPSSSVRSRYGHKNNSQHHHNNHSSSVSPHSSASRSSASTTKWSRILIIAFCQLASVLSQALSPGPKFGEPIPNVTVAVGRDASLPCVVENLGNHKVAWVHIDRRMILTIHKHIVTRIPRFSVSYDSHKTWLLHVNSVQQEDRGYYMCQVNTEPMMSQVGYLQVVVPPNICDDESSESHVAVREGLNITLSCKAEGFPEPRITWKREDGQPFSIDKRRKVNSSDGERLQLYRISRLEMGAYLCIASNGVPPSVSKRIIVDVEFSPMIWVPNQLVGAPAGTNVTLECNTEAFPRAISYWVYDDMMILTTGKYNTETIETSYKTHMKLTIRNLREKDFGRYRCLSKNSLGEAEGAIRLYEIPQPSLAPKATEVRHSKDTPVNVVRLTPIPKTDDNKRNKFGNRDYDGKSKQDQNRGSTAGTQGIDTGKNAIHVPSIESASSTTSGSSVIQLNPTVYLIISVVVTKLLTNLSPRVLRL